MPGTGPEPGPDSAVVTGPEPSPETAPPVVKDDAAAPVKEDGESGFRHAIQRGISLALPGGIWGCVGGPVGMRASIIGIRVACTPERQGSRDGRQGGWELQARG